MASATTTTETLVPLPDQRRVRRPNQQPGARASKYRGDAQFDRETKRRQNCLPVFA
jgi:hypothetical protein